jgi:hypothetical protein
MDLQEQFYETDRARLRRWLPWLHLSRAFRIAIDPRKLLLGAAAFVLLAGGQWAIARLPFAREARLPTGGSRTNGAAEPLPVWPWDRPVLPGGQGPPSFRGLLDAPWKTLSGAATGGVALLEPLRSVVDPGLRLFRRDNSWGDAATAWTELLWALAVWAVCGAAIARMASVEFAQPRRLGLREAVRYVGARFLSCYSAPLLPLVFVGLFWLLCVLAGLVGRIPGVGDALAGALWFVPLLLGLAIAMVALIIATGWPLMYCAVSADGGDGFDGLSRAYDYLLTRPWTTLGLGLAALVQGSLLVFFAYGVVGMGVETAEWAVGAGLGDERVEGLTSEGPPLVSGWAGTGAASESSEVGRRLAAFWLRVVAALLWGFVGSYFWTAMTIIYFLLRKSVDATPLEHVYVERPPDGGKLPLVGMAAAERREANSEPTG